MLLRNTPWSTPHLTYRFWIATLSHAEIQNGYYCGLRRNITGEDTGVPRPGRALKNNHIQLIRLSTETVHKGRDHATGRPPLFTALNALDTHDAIDEIADMQQRTSDDATHSAS